MWNWSQDEHLVYMPNDDWRQFVTSASAIAVRFPEPLVAVVQNWHCAYCSSAQPATRASCSQCGAPKANK